MARVSNEGVEAEIRNRRPFDNNNSTMGGGRRFRGWGDLPPHLRLAVAPAGIAYWVYSYDTPIAWVDTAGDVTMPHWGPGSRQPETLTHQRLAAKALDVERLVTD